MDECGVSALICRFSARVPKGYHLGEPGPRKIKDKEVCRPHMSGPAFDPVVVFPYHHHHHHDEPP